MLGKSLLSTCRASLSALSCVNLCFFLPAAMASAGCWACLPLASVLLTTPPVPFLPSLPIRAAAAAAAALAGGTDGVPPEQKYTKSTKLRTIRSQTFRSMTTCCVDLHAGKCSTQVGDPTKTLGNLHSQRALNNSACLVCGPFP